MPEKTDSTRTRRTPQQIAQDALDVADARVEKAEKRNDKAQAEVNAAGEELKRAKAFRDYAAKNPDLGTQDAGDVALDSMAGNTED